MSPERPPHADAGDAAEPLPPISLAGAWNVVSLGLALKLGALLLFVLGLPAIVGVQWARGADLLDPWWPALAVVTVAAALDIAGRCLCLAVPAQAAPRSLVLTSVLCQLAALACVDVALVLHEDRAAALALVVGGFVLQAFAALQFVQFLSLLARQLRQPIVSRIAAATLALTGGLPVAFGATLALVASVVLAVFVLLAVVGCLFCGCWGLALPAAVARQGAWQDWAIQLGVVLLWVFGPLMLLLYLLYGLTLFGLWRALRADVADLPPPRSPA